MAVMPSALLDALHLTGVSGSHLPTQLNSMRWFAEKVVALPFPDLHHGDKPIDGIYI
jgi:hypothetical protein